MRRNGFKWLLNAAMLGGISSLSLPQQLKAQGGLFDQSSSGIEWQMISNPVVDVIYPKQSKAQAIYVANLIEHYSHVVGLTFEIPTPKKVTLILRTEMAEPNAFVTLAPRRSEFYSSSSFSPLVGSLDWFQILSIHEYRHVNQNDFFVQGAVKYLDYAFGDVGINLADSLSLWPWYAEGDAVWAETKYTQAGRGRSPHFLARLKAILLTGKTPTYDEFLNGTYKNELVNHYVYGYVLIANGYKKFGDDFWKRVIARTAKFPHPWRFLHTFKEESGGQDFESFYDETFAELKAKWAKDSFPELKETDYVSESLPAEIDGTVYYLKYDLDHYPAIYKRQGDHDSKISDIPELNGLTQIDFSREKAIYSQFRPDSRFGFKSTASLVLLDLKDGSKSNILTGKRIYSPKLSLDGTKVLAVEFTDTSTWELIESDLQGIILNRIALPGNDIVEATYLDQQNAIAIINDTNGGKSIIKIDLVSKKTEVVLPPSQNTLFNIRTDGLSSVYFEAQYKGNTEIFKVDINSKEAAQCTQSRIAAYNPYATPKMLYYSEMIPYGQRIVAVPTSACKAMPVNELIAFNYLGDTPSDNYAKQPIVEFKDLAALRTQNAEGYQPKEYNGFDKRTFIPHSWNFLGGRGLSLSLVADNYLGDFQTTLFLGSDSEENTPYASLEFTFKRYYPVFTLGVSAVKRSVDLVKSDSQLDWRENSLYLTALLPYTAKNDLYSFNAGLGFAVTGSQISKVQLDTDGDKQDIYSGTSGLVKNTVTLTARVAKDETFRSLISPWSLGFSGFYENAKSADESQLNSYRTFGSLKATNPGLALHDAFKWELSDQRSNPNAYSYKFKAAEADPGSYAFSRGYDYFQVDHYEKASANYLFPIAYPDLNLWGWFYTKRITGTLFYDHTWAQAAVEHYILDSEGAELLFESTLIRRIPFDIGVRYSYRHLEKDSLVNIFLGSSLTVF